MDWSTNLAIKQLRAVQGHFFFNKQLSLHPMVLWHQGGSSSICTFSDSICHKAAATWAGISGLLYEILREGYMKIVFISDSPTKQYRNRYIASLLEHLVDTYPEEITVKWIYLESGHGKGAADGVGATVKSKLKKITARDDNADFSAEELKKSYLEEDQNVRVITYSKDDVDKIKKSSSYTNAVAKKGIASSHEIVITRGKTTLKKRSGELVYRTFTRRVSTPVSLAIPVSTTPSRPVFVPAAPGSTSTVADEIPATLTIINSFSTPPAAQAYSYRELLDNKRLYDDLIWVVLRVQTLKQKRTLHYVGQIMRYIEEEEVYMVQPYTLINSPGPVMCIFKKLNEPESYLEEDILFTLEKPTILPRNKIQFSLIPNFSSLAIM